MTGSPFNNPTPTQGGGSIVVSQNSSPPGGVYCCLSELPLGGGLLLSLRTPPRGGVVSQNSSTRGGGYCCPSELPPQGRTLRTPPCTLYIGYTLYTLYTSYTLYTLYTLYITHTREKGKPGAPKRKRESSAHKRDEGKRWHPLLRSNSTKQPDRTHAHTAQHETISWLDSPPNLRQNLT